MPSLFLILFIGLATRLLLVGNPGFLADIAFWKSWSLAALDHGFVWTTYNSNINYPPGFIYILYLMGKIYSFLGNPHDYNSYWSQNNFGFLFASKSIAIISDVLVTLIIYWFFSHFSRVIPSPPAGGSRNLGHQAASSRSQRLLDPSTPSQSSVARDDKLRLFFSAIFFLNPIVILDSAVWGQVESFGILWTLLAIILIFNRRPLPATIFFTVGILMKLQNIIYIPLYFLFIFRYFDLRTVFKSLAVATATFFMVNLPFVLANEMKQVLYLMTVNSDYFPWMSLNAHNLWWIVSGASGMEVTDRITVFGISNAKTIGLLIFSGIYFLLCLLIYRKPTPRNFLLVLLMAILAFFLFTTESHERYSYPVIILLLFLYPFLERKTNNVQKYFWFVYLLLSLAIFFNIHTGLVINYPQNGIGILTKITTSQLTLLNSYVFILGFILLLPYIFSEMSYWFITIPFLIIVSGITLSNASYFFKRKVSLTAFKPVIEKQDYGTPQINKAVNSIQGWKSWSRLSGNYFYYNKGFGSHANSHLVFDINRKFNKFTTDFGVDTESSTLASVVFKIYGDNTELYTSSKMGRFDFPQHAEINVKGVKHLELTITDAGDGINNDHADWLNPVLYK
ncbi:hypothetical protein A2960_04130 [Candidatus Gottesmanbacteria bacterium RIFCSPLOWO2_01_FULL_39_12b]|uniref:Glycosyl hydrolase family 98 putative carbohydrate-binding module domain-containing protein n=1 Tax=Candidatus Gottesmanbacteria bacterium RIFCSPLOWO2_01_FULL_39_12b TaxID=1798388 RepID=A0A1F6AN93_9BACT|nr:MAG: hypothetical protein A2960_04130 [Candidatus Gottesmanbacteria bacterium RIFCSPLOWO2_01_FULL_39_12b]